jgi:hypothetical protein
MTIFGTSSSQTAICGSILRIIAQMQVSHARIARVLKMCSYNPLEASNNHILNICTVQK